MQLAKDILLLGDVGAARGALSGASDPSRGSLVWMQGQWARTVASGETMWSIARDLLGSGTRWRDLWAAQSEGYRAIRDPSLLVAGDILAVPSSVSERAKTMSLIRGLISGNIGDASDAADSGGGDYVSDLPTVGPFGPQTPTTRGGSDSGGGGAVHDTQDPNSPSYVGPTKTQPGPGPGPSPKPPSLMVSSSAWPWVVGGVAVTGIGAGLIYYFTR